MLCLVAVALSVAPANAATPVVVGSKAFPESWILADALASLARGADAETEVEHRKNLGGTDIAFQALETGSIDVYPEYTGTIAEVILKSRTRLSLTELRDALAAKGLALSDPLGFNDGYALAVPRRTASRLQLRSISQLRAHPDIAAAMSHEFLGRSDGLVGLSRTYQLALRNVRGVQHDLAYQGIAAGDIELTDIYTTDPQIERLSLELLDDDAGFFARYDAVYLYRSDLAQRAPSVLQAMTRLAGRIDEAAMTRANGDVVLRHASSELAARALLERAAISGAIAISNANPTVSPPQTIARSVLRNLLVHLQLVFASLLAAIAFGVPMGVFATRSRAVSILALGASGLLQTIPSLALLAFLIPVLGIGVRPALAALFLYGLLPIVQNTLAGLRSIPRALDEAADAIGLTPFAKLRLVLLPLASRSILAGIRTSAVITIGTATLAALIGAGGLGNPIMQGIALRDSSLILQGAVPAALLALMAQAAFAGLERWVVPRGLRAPTSRRMRAPTDAPTAATPSDGPKTDA
jgi:osmoprotectant transport system permease protein